jgi:4-oxalocrotonate tautomerase
VSLMNGYNVLAEQCGPREGVEDANEKEEHMPHVIVKLWPGKSEEQKTRLAEEITQDVMRVLNYGEESVSVAIEEIEPQDWAEEVYKPDIVNNSEKLYKKPGYTM